MIHPKWNGSIHVFHGKNPKNQLVEWTAQDPEQRADIPVWTIDFRSYFVQGFVPFAQSYLSPDAQNQRCICEVIRANRPVKVYLDIDIDRPQQHSWFSMHFMNESFVPSVIEFVQDALRASGRLSIDMNPIVLSAHTPEKFSMHLIFPVLLPSVDCVKELVVEKVVPMSLATFPHVKTHQGGKSPIDCVVYNHGRNFRIIHSPKPGKQNHLILDTFFAKRFGHETLTLLQVFNRSLITVYELHSHIFRVPEEWQDGLLLSFDDSIVQTHTRLTHRTHQASTAAEVQEVFNDKETKLIHLFIDGLIKKFEEKIHIAGEIKAFDDKYGRYVKFQVAPSLPCIFNGLKSHHSNTTYVDIRFSGGCKPIVKCQCTDAECSTQAYTLDCLNDLLIEALCDCQFGQN